MKNILSSNMAKRNASLMVLAVFSIITSFSLGIKSSGDVHPFTLIEAGSTSIEGDIDDNGTVDLQDVILILEMTQGYTTVSPEAYGADPNKDGRITVDDALRILHELLES